MSPDSTIFPADDINTEATPSEELFAQWTQLYQHPIEKELGEREIKLDTSFDSEHIDVKAWVNEDEDESSCLVRPKT
jgi:hypothetical protein